FQRRCAALVGEAGGIVAARVLEALVFAGAGLGVGGGRVDRRHHRAGARVRGLAGVDGEGAETGFTAGFTGRALAHGGHSGRTSGTAQFSTWHPPPCSAGVDRFDLSRAGPSPTLPRAPLFAPPGAGRSTGHQTWVTPVGRLCSPPGWTTGQAGSRIPAPG